MLIGPIIGKLRSSLSQCAKSLHEALEEASEQSLWDRCQQQTVSSSNAFAQADLSVLAWQVEHDGPTTDLELGTIEQNVQDIQERLNKQAGYLACNQRSTSTLQPNAIRLREAEVTIDNLLNNLCSDHAAPSGHHIDSELDSEKVLDPRVRDQLNVLSYALTQQLSSCEHRHAARLKLTSLGHGPLNHLLPDFELFLSSRFDWQPCRWLLSRCKVVRSLTDTEPPGCHFMTEAESRKHHLSLLLGEEPIGSVLRSEGHYPVTSAIPTVSLGTLIDDGLFKSVWGDDNKTYLPMDRAILCSTMARSLVHLLDDCWLNVRWNIDDIFVLQDPSTHELLDKGKPYLSWTPGCDSADTDQEYLGVHHTGRSRHGQLVEFAQLLMEIHEGERMPPQGSASDLQTALWTKIHENRRFAFFQQNWREAVVACLGPGGKEAAEDNDDPDHLREYLYQHVLQKLDASVQQWKEPDLSPTLFAPVQGTEVVRSFEDTHVPSPYDSSHFDHPEDPAAAANASKFMSLMGSFTSQHIQCRVRTMLPGLRPHLGKKVKVAIIDSGAFKDDPRIIGAIKAGAIAEGRNFLPHEAADDWNDVNGHGTHIAGLLVKLAPEAELYIAKVTDGQRINRDQVNCIAQAINWAVQKWQVDIITMSLVLQEEHAGIAEELKQALNPNYEGEGVCRKIVFAAAGNTGANDLTPWPANMDGVIAIHATDGLGSAHNINTPATAEHNFATLGRDIEVRWKLPHGRTKKVYVSGTSFATPIAAAIASNVLEYARRNLALTQDQKKFLYSGACMTKLFDRMSLQKGDYKYLQPWTLWKHGYGPHRDVRDVLANVIAMG